MFEKMEQAEQFRMQRIAHLRRDAHALIPNSVDGKLLIHLLPAISWEPNSEFLLMESPSPDYLPPLYNNGWLGKRNFDGYLTYDASRCDQIDTYTLLFRNGRIEAANKSLFLSEQGHRHVSARLLLRESLGKILKYLRFMRQCGMPYPVDVAISLMNMRGYQLYLARQTGLSEPCDRSDLLLPLLRIDANTDIKLGLKQRFDLVWHAFALPACEDFDRYFEAASLLNGWPDVEKEASAMDTTPT